MIPAAHMDTYTYDFGGGDITLLLKHALPLTKVASLTGKSVWDVTDDHYDNKILRDYYLTVPHLVDVVTCTTPVLAERIKLETGVTAVVIPDPVEFVRKAPRITQPNKLFWYGHQSNLQALFDLRLDHSVLIVTNTDEPWCFPYNAENMNMGFKWCDAVIIPSKETGSGPRKNAKSSNRMTEAINAGRFVIANHVPSYEGWNMWLGDIEEGIEWLRNNQEEALCRLQAAQDKVTALLAPQVIARQWKALFDSILGVEQSDGRDLSTSILPITVPERRQMLAQT
jgi:hypothetical protein